MTGRLFDISDFATQDGPGIRTVLFFKGCPLRCQWCSNPESQNFYSEPLHHSDRCVSCGACKTACSAEAIQIEGGYAIDHSKCAECMDYTCEAVCPHKAISIVGRDYSLEQIMTRILPNRAFYQNSGGGITFSGGEAMAQSDFAFALAECIKDEGLGLGLETCGYGYFEKHLDKLRLFDFVFFDLKLMEENAHKYFTGAALQPVLDNLKLLVDTIGGDKIHLSNPVIPGVNDTERFIESAGELALNLGISKFRLLPYHELGMAKYAALSRDYPLNTTNKSDQSKLQSMAHKLRSMGMHCEVVGYL